MQYCVGSPNLCPRCGGRLDEEYMPLFSGDCTQHITICGECYDLLHDRFARHRKAWQQAYWQDEFDTVVRLHDLTLEK